MVRQIKLQLLSMLKRNKFGKSDQVEISIHVKKEGICYLSTSPCMVLFELEMSPRAF